MPADKRKSYKKKFTKRVKVVTSTKRVKQVVSPTKRANRRSPTKKKVSCLTKSRKRKHKSFQKEPLANYKYVEYPEYTNKSELVDKDLRHKVIRGATMQNMNLSGTKLQGTKFVDCTFDNTIFDNAHIDSHTEFINCSFKNCATDHIKYVDGAIKERFDRLFALYSTSSV